MEKFLYRFEFFDEFTFWFVYEGKDWNRIYSIERKVFHEGAGFC